MSENTTTTELTVPYLQVDPDQVDGSVFHPLRDLGLHLRHGVDGRLRHPYHVDAVDLLELGDEECVDHLVVPTTGRTGRKSHLVGGVK